MITKKSARIVSFIMIFTFILSLPAIAIDGTSLSTASSGAGTLTLEEYLSINGIDTKQRSGTISVVSDSANETMAVSYKTHLSNDVISETIVVAYTEDDSGELSVTSPTQSAARDSSGYTMTDDINFCLVSTAYYFMYYNYTTYAPYWRPYQLSIRCTEVSNSSNVNITSISGNFVNIGEIYSYPDCVTAEEPTLLYCDDGEEDVLDYGSSFYYHYVQTTQANPVLGNTYVGYKQLPSNYALYYGSLPGIGSYVKLSVTYASGGVTRTEENSYSVYSL